METTAKFSVSATGESTGKSYAGDFVVKTVLTRRDIFVADERRRIIVGSNAEAVPPALNGEAFMLGQLLVRIVDAPDWWKTSDGGMNIEDANIIGELFRLTLEREEERLVKLKESSKKALKELSK